MMSDTMARRRLRQLALQVDPCAGIASRSSKSQNAVESKEMFDNKHTDGPAPTLRPGEQTANLANAPEAGTKPLNDPSGLWGRGYEHSNVREKLPKVPSDVKFDDTMKAKYVEWINLRRDKGTGAVKGLDQWQSLTDSKLFRDKVDEDPYTEPSPPRAPRTGEVEVVICGVGFAGILCGARMKEAGITDVLMMEKGGDVGGTWYWNRYPGIACDVESYAYMPLLEETNYVPTMKYASGFEIQEHCRRIMNHFELYSKFMGHTTITGTTWDETAKRWTVRTDKNDAVKARFVILCNGIMTVPRLTKLPGMDDYAGATFHTSRWDYSHDLRGKTVGIIGTGCTACQCIPELAKVVKELYVFQRTPSSIDVRNNIRTSPEMEAKFLRTPGWADQRKKNYDAFMGEGRAKPSGRKKRAELSEAEEQVVQDKQAANNFAVAQAIRMRVPTKVRDPQTAAALQQWCTIGSKRPVFHDEYLSSFNLPHVHLIDTEGAGVERVTVKGPLANGQEYPVEVLIYATGFEHMVTGTFNEIRNGQGMSMKEKWANGTKTFLGDHTSGFPNLMIINGPQAAGATFNMLSQCDVQVKYMVQLMQHMRAKGYTTVDVTPEAEEKFSQHCADSDRRQQITRWGPYAAISYYNWQGTKRFGDTEYVGGQKYFGFQDEALNSLTTGTVCGDELLSSGELKGMHVYKFT